MVNDSGRAHILINNLVVQGNFGIHKSLSKTQSPDKYKLQNLVPPNPTKSGATLGGKIFKDIILW